MKSKVYFFRILVIGFFIQLISFNYAEGQRLTYEGFLKGEKVGELVAEREVNDENVKIIIRTKLDAQLIVKIKLELYSESTYINQSLFQASSTAKVNGQLKSDVQTVKYGNEYQVEVDGKKRTLAHSELLGADLFYFEEPKGIKHAYALSSGEMIEITETAKQTYYFKRNGKKEFHKYSEGVLDELEINHKLFTITFKLKKEL